MSSSLILPDEDFALGDPDEIRSKLEHDVDLVIDAGTVSNQVSTVIDWHEDKLKVVRVGAGDIAFLTN